MSRLQNLVGLLQLIEASGGDIETRIRIQKEAYLIGLIGLIVPDSFNVHGFEYHYYGPYDRGLSEALQFSVSSGLVEETDTSPEDKSFTKYCYALTEKGRASLTKLNSASARFVELADLLKFYDWRALELVATVRFLQLEEGLGEEDALEKALELKPTPPLIDKQQANCWSNWSEFLILRKMHFFNVRVYPSS